MKKAYGFALVAASLLLASGAQAQSLHVRADVPFAFSIGEKAYPAGSYDVQQNGPALTIESERKMDLVLPRTCTSLDAAKKTVLIFNRVGDEYFLYQIWTAGNNIGRELPQPKHETMLARNGQKSETVVVAANLIAK